MADWISVYDKLPKSTEKVLIFIDDCPNWVSNVIHIGWHSLDRAFDDYSEDLWYIYPFGDTVIRTCTVTRWMPLPKKPLPLK